jgi:Uma2 family endonuclease
VSSSKRTRTQTTYDDILALPDHVVGEIVDGELIVSPRPAAPHARASTVLGGDIGPPFDRGRGGPGGWWIVDEPELHLEEQILVPDLAGWRRERMPSFPTTAFFTLSPDWICEVLAPSSARLERIKKLSAYLEQGVRWAWLVDPLARTLEVFESLGNRWTLAAAFEGDAVVRAIPFDAIAIEIEIGGWWVPGEETAGQPAP